MLNKLVYDNINYEVRVVQEKDSTYLTYGVINKEYNVIDFESRSLPQALYTAESCDRDLRGKIWLAQAEKAVPMDLSHSSTKPELLN